MSQDEFESIFDELPSEIKDLLVRIKISIPNRKPISCNVMPLVKTSYDHLEDQLQQTPSIFCFWGMVHAEQKMIVSVLELNLQKRKATLATDMIKQSKEDGFDIRRSDIKDVLESDTEVLRLQAKLVLEEKSLNKMNVLMDALRMKSEHLRSLSGFKKQELRDA
jgi:hypothetical protein